MAWFIGLMSGTSLDGVDGVLVRFSDDSEPVRAQVAAHVCAGLSAALRGELLALNRAGGIDELHRAALAAHAVADAYAQVAGRLLAEGGVAAGDVAAIGAHGQTVRHRPGEFDGTGYTVQLLDGALLAERTGIAVVCDFRSRDVAAGGQGAPLVPAFHAACFGSPGTDTAVLNLGGIANLTLLGAGGGVRGFDSGPANVLMDSWCERHCGQRHDAEGGWAAGGRVIAPLLNRLLDEPYFERAAPKSTGRDLFDSAWLDDKLSGMDEAVPQDVMATLAELTARTVCDALRRHAPGTRQLLVCGGGAFNTHLMGRIAALCGADGCTVASSDSAGVPPDQVEAMAFAWLAAAHLGCRSGNVPAVTGARAPRDRKSVV